MDNNMLFTILNQSEKGFNRFIPNRFYLVWDNWNDYSFLTLYRAFYIDEKLVYHGLGNIKIGYFGQRENERKTEIGMSFNQLPPIFFSVGLDDNYYQKLNSFGSQIRDTVLNGLNDIAKNPNIYEKAIKEDVTQVSLLRGLSSTTVTGQFRRMAMGGARLTPFHFKYIHNLKNNPIVISFDVEPESFPPSNIHVLIGKNGVGKTTLINSMITVLTKQDYTNGHFEIDQSPETSFFANLVYVTFSAFDEYVHPVETKESPLGLKYSYIGLKKFKRGEITLPKDLGLLREEFVDSIFFCKNNNGSERWKKAINILESDRLFREENISNLIDINDLEKLKVAAGDIFNSLSSGHKIVLLTITRLVETIQEKSLILLDEPECHLHPPLLSSFTRALSELLIDKNGVCIIATHSPVVLQEVPSSCIWKLRRDSQSSSAERLEIESFGENVGILTQEVFGLEVTDSGFHNILKTLVTKYKNYDEVIAKLDGQLGLEAKSILRSLFFQKNY